MPVDKAGNRAEIISSSNSTVARSNWGRAFVPYFAAASRDVRKRLLYILESNGISLEKLTEETVELMDDALFESMYGMLLRFYSIVSPRQYYWYTQKVVDRATRSKHLFTCLKEKIYLNMAVDNPINDVDTVIRLEAEFPQTYDTVTYRGVDGNYHETVDPIRIDPNYMMLLEKIADDGSSANIGKLQHHGLLASQTKTEKYSQNYRPNHTRNFGEAEMRLTVFYAKTLEAAAEIHDRNNNPDTMNRIAHVLLRHPTPTNIDRIVDRKIIPYNGTRPLQFLQHFMNCQGAEVAYISESEAFKLSLEEDFRKGMKGLFNAG